MNRDSARSHHLVLDTAAAMAKAVLQVSYLANLQGTKKAHTPRIGRHNALVRSLLPDAARRSLANALGRPNSDLHSTSQGAAARGDTLKRNDLPTVETLISNAQSH